jgi:hypothetical protein
MIQLAWRFLMFQKESALAVPYRNFTGPSPLGRDPCALSAPISLCLPGGRVTPRSGVFPGQSKSWSKGPPFADGSSDGGRVPDFRRTALGQPLPSWRCISGSTRTRSTTDAFLMPGGVMAGKQHTNRSANEYEKTSACHHHRQRICMQCTRADADGLHQKSLCAMPGRPSHTLRNPTVPTVRLWGRKQLRSPVQTATESVHEHLSAASMTGIAVLVQFAPIRSGWSAAGSSGHRRRTGSSRSSRPGPSFDD